METGDVDISILTPTIQSVEASAVQPGDIMNEVFVGDGLFETTGEVTVVGEGSFLERKQLGEWIIDHGTGNIQSVVGTGHFRVQTTAASGMPGGLHILNSDIDGNGILVYQGTLTVDAGSKVTFVEVFDNASAYVTLGSQIGNVQTHDRAYLSLKESIATSGFPCGLEGTVLVEDSVFRCGAMSVHPGATVDVRTLNASSSRLDITNHLSVVSGSLDVSNTIATTGTLQVTNTNVHLGIGQTQWTNAGGVRIFVSSTSASAGMTVYGGSHYHDLGTIRVAGEPAVSHLRVTEANTEFEVDGDLRIGEYTVVNQDLTYSGNVTVADGATVTVHGTLAIRPLGVLNLEPGGTVYAESIENDGTINENGGTLVLPEPASALTGAAACAALLSVARGRRLQR